jgi:opacity protein-like surface antigen
MTIQTRSTRLVFCALTAAVLIAAPASADIRVTGFGGVTNVDDANKRTFGAAVTLSTLFGVEVEAARASLGGFEGVSIVDVDAALTTYMANAVVRAPLGPLQPYGSAGIGIVRVTGDVNIPFLGSVLTASAQDVGWNVGGGVYLLPTPNFGVRADVRRFQTGDVEWEDITGIGDLPLPKFDFWRATIGLTVKF